jgi:hypothetical protein
MRCSVMKNELSCTRVERLAALAPFAPFLHVARRVERLLSVRRMPFLTVTARKLGSRASALGLCFSGVSFVDCLRFGVASDAMSLLLFVKFEF